MTSRYLRNQSHESWSPRTSRSYSSSWTCPRRESQTPRLPAQFWAAPEHVLAPSRLPLCRHPLHQPHPIERVCEFLEAEIIRSIELEPDIESDVRRTATTLGDRQNAIRSDILAFELLSLRFGRLHNQYHIIRVLGNLVRAAHTF